MGTGQATAAGGMTPHLATSREPTGLAVPTRVAFARVLVTSGGLLGAVARHALEDLGKGGELFGAQCG